MTIEHRDVRLAERVRSRDVAQAADVCLIGRDDTMLVHLGTTAATEPVDLAAVQ
jgi:hypothetical protein